MSIYLVDYLRELIFPTACAGCGEYEGELICPDCLRSLPLIPAPVCARCANPTLHPVDECRECRRYRLALDATIALAFYRDPMRSVIHRFKYRNGRRLAPLLAALLAARLEESPPPGPFPQAVTFVPMHPRRERERGYNQSRLLAEGLARHLGVECRSLLARNKAAPPQAGLSLDRRRANLRGCLEIKKGLDAPRSILLVDDVFTTGATLSECARVLKSAGAEQVVACVLARDLPLVPLASRSL